MLFNLIVEEVQPREIEGPSTNLALSDIISNVLPQTEVKKEKNENNLVRFILLSY